MELETRRVRSQVWETGTKPNSMEVLSRVIRIGWLPVPLSSTCVGLGRLPALWVMDTDPESAPTDVGSNCTVTVRESPGEIENGPAPLRMANPDEASSTVPLRVPLEVTAFEMMKVSSRVWLTDTVPKSMEVLSRLMRIHWPSTPVRGIEVGLDRFVAL